MNRRRQAGYTFLEAALFIVLFGFLAAVMGRSYAASEGVTRESRVNLRAHEDLRRNLEAVANVLRDVDFDSIAGFDLDGVATEPTFVRVLGADRYGQVKGAPERIVWRANPLPVPGVTRPGHLVHLRDGAETRIAGRVPEGGFRVRFGAGLLQIQMTTYYVVTGRTVAVSGSTSLVPRN